MIRDLKNVLEVIDDLKASNLVNAQILKKALLDINVRLEEISDGDELIFIRNSLADFKEALDTKFNNVFDNINQLKNSVRNDEVAAENIELMQDRFQALFDVFDAGIKSVAEKIDNIEKDFSKISDENIQKSKEEFAQISKELSAYQNEIKLTNKANEQHLTEQISKLREGLKLFTDNINSQTNTYKSFVETKTEEIREFIEQNEENIKNNNSQAALSLTEKFKELEETNLKFTDDLEIIKGSLVQLQHKTNEFANNNDSGAVVQQLSTVAGSVEDSLNEIRILQDYSGSIIKALNSLSDFVRKPNEEILESIKNLDISANVSDLFEKLVQEKIKSMFSVFDSSIKLMVTKIDDIESIFSKIADANLTATKEEFAKISRELLIHQQEILDTHKTFDENTIERFTFVAESIKLLSENINIQTDMYKDYVEKKTTEINEFISKNENNILEDNSFIKAELETKFKELEEANHEFTNDLETLKSSITEVLNKTETIPQETTDALTKEFKLVNDTAQDTLAEIKVLQDFSENMVKSLNYLTAYCEKNQNEDIFEAIKELDINTNIAELFEKIDIFNNNFNIKTEFLEDQIQQLKAIFADLAVDLRNKEAEFLQRESQRVQEYYGKIEEVSTSLLNLEQSLKLSGIEYKEHIQNLNKELTSFIQEFNSIYNEIAGAAQIEINNSIEELKQFINVNSANYNDKFIIIQQQFAHAFTELHEAVKNQDLQLVTNLNQSIESLNTKIDIIAATDLTENFDEIADLISETNAKIDTLAETDLTENFQEIADKITITNAKIEAIAATDLNKNFNEISDKINETNAKIDALATTDLGENIEEISKKINETNAKIDVLAATDLTENFDEITDKINETNAKIDVLATNDYTENFDEILENVSDNKNILKELQAKLDVFVATSDNDILEDELQEIKDIILEQRQILSEDKGSDNALINENIEKLLEKINGISKTIDEHDDNSTKIKEDLVNTIVSVFSNSNFVEETEEIKDFVEEKTDELNKHIADVKSQLATIKQSEISEYSYTLTDVETDIAKLRQVINDMSSNTSSAEINQISRNIHNLTSSIDSISKNLTPAEIYQLKNNILKLNDDILSISSRTNKLLLNSDESQKTISEGLLAFTHIAYNLEERINELSNKEFNAEIASKMEKALIMLENSASMDATFHQVMMFLGEWVDAASNTFESINDKTSEISEISDALSELRKSVPEKFALIDLLEERFEEQQSRLDRLEAKIDELTGMGAKVDKMEHLMTTLNTNIEKLTSYVD